MGAGSALTIPVEQLTNRQLWDYEMEVKRKLLEQAKKTQTGTTDRDWIIREGVWGRAGTDVTDFTMRTAQIAAGDQHYAQDQADITVDALSSVLATGSTIEDNTFVAFWGLGDLSPEGGNLTGAADISPPVGSLIGVSFHRGGSRLSHWNTQDMYTQDTPMLVAEEPIIYEQNEKIDLKMEFSEAAEDKFIIFRVFVCERHSEEFAPDKDMWAFVSKFQQNLNAAFPGTAFLPGGTKAFDEWPLEYLQVYRTTIKQQLIEMAILGKIATSQDELVFREVKAGDQGGEVDWTDLNTDVGTAQFADQQYWAQDTTSYTAGDLSNVLIAAETVPDSKAIAVFGFYDRSTSPNATLLSCETGGGKKFLTEIEHCYLSPAVPQGFFLFPVFYRQNEKIDIKLSVKVAKDTFIGFHTMIVEKWGDIVSKD